VGFAPHIKGFTMELEFAVNDDMFLTLFGIYLVFFAIMWTISYTLKMIRI